MVTNQLLNNGSINEISSILVEGEISDPRLITSGSNYTFSIRIKYKSKAIRAIYKPRIGEKPLHDFTSGTLYKREYASYVVATALGLDFIPDTVVRDGPYGIGSVQQFIDIEPDSNYFTIISEHPNKIAEIALFDCITNNADRKASHCFMGRDGRIWGIDHGLTFHPIWKLRTVIWDFAEKPIPQPLVNNISNFLNDLSHNQPTYEKLTQLLDDEEINALKNRLTNFANNPFFPPYDPTRRNIPLPWF